MYKYIYLYHILGRHFYTFYTHNNNKTSNTLFIYLLHVDHMIAAIMLGSTDPKHCLLIIKL